MEQQNYTRQKVTKSESHVEVNLALLALVFTIFTLLITIKPSVLQQDNFLVIQLVLTIPLFMTSTLARLQLITLGQAKRLKDLAHVSFLVAYSFLINVIGILLNIFTSYQISLLFFAVNIFMALIYSLVLANHSKEHFWKKLGEDAYFFVSLLVLGIFHIMGIW
ncbi:MAG: hypothetical protein AABW79_01105 [Nanoarchaeota archaeon]